MKRREMNCKRLSNLSQQNHSGRDVFARIGMASRGDGANYPTALVARSERFPFSPDAALMVHTDRGQVQEDKTLPFLSPTALGLCGFIPAYQVSWKASFTLRAIFALKSGRKLFSFVVKSRSGSPAQKAIACRIANVRARHTHCPCDDCCPFWRLAGAILPARTTCYRNHRREKLASVGRPRPPIYGGDFNQCFDVRLGHSMNT